MKKHTLRLFYILILIVGIILQFSRVFIDEISWISYFGIPIMCLGISLLVNSFEFNKKRKDDNIYNKSITEKRKDEILIDEFKYCDLQCFINCIKLYYSTDLKKRLIIFAENEKSVLVRLQELEIYDSDITNTPIYCGIWKTIDGKGSFYFDLQCALEEYKNELDKGYTEVDIEKIKETIWNGYSEYYAEIEWIKEINGGRTSIPYGNRYWPQIIIEGNKRPQHSIILRNIEGIGKYKTIALVKYAFPGAPNDLRENLSFYVCEGNRKVAKGIITAKRENIDI